MERRLPSQAPSSCTSSRRWPSRSTPLRGPYRHCRRYHHSHPSVDDLRSPCTCNHRAHTSSSSHRTSSPRLPNPNPSLRFRRRKLARIHWKPGRVCRIRSGRLRPSCNRPRQSPPSDTGKHRDCKCHHRPRCTLALGSLCRRSRSKCETPPRNRIHRASSSSVSIQIGCNWPRARDSRSPAFPSGSPHPARGRRHTPFRRSSVRNRAGRKLLLRSSWRVRSPPIPLPSTHGHHTCSRRSSRSPVCTPQPRTRSRRMSA